MFSPLSFAIHLTLIFMKPCCKFWIHAVSCLPRLWDKEIAELVNNISEHLSKSFKTVRGDLVFSDFVAGFIILYKKQNRESRENSNNTTNPPVTESERTNSILPENTQFWQDIEWTKIQWANHFLKFAAGAYKINELHSRQNLLKNCARDDLPLYVVNSRVCCCRLQKFKEQCGLEDEDIKLVSFKSGLFVLPHYIAVDHRSKSVVVGIRGTKCTSDVLTDLVCEDAPIKIEPRRLMYKGHKGMVESANQINREIVDILLAVLGEHSNYGLVVTVASFYHFGSSK
ncbi:diacylglycerol lipase-beta-like isoform X3 [Artemia franciscana]|uniref:diacylglycerol lipase-beta-like isoform X3 n=1 Tax=Artemia franciscana TaxID=6661 RepID=UPI0032D9C4F7